MTGSRVGRRIQTAKCRIVAASVVGWVGLLREVSDERKLCVCVWRLVFDCSDGLSPSENDTGSIDCALMKWSPAVPLRALTGWVMSFACSSFSVWNWDCFLASLMSSGYYTVLQVRQVQINHGLCAAQLGAMLLVLLQALPLIIAFYFPICSVAIISLPLPEEYWGGMFVVNEGKSFWTNVQRYHLLSSFLSTKPLSLLLLLAPHSVTR